jgi:nucleotide-binding universal stress UspA family protein
MMLGHVLVAVDDSTESIEAARSAAGLVAGAHGAIRLLTVIPAGSDAARRTAAVQLLEHAARVVAGAGIARSAIDRIVQSGEPFRCILDEALAWPADLIVMAVSDHHGLRSPYVGSEVEHVLEFTRCPVLVVPGTER